MFLGGIGSPCMFIRDNWLLFSQFCCMSCDQRNLDKLLWYLGLQILVIINHLRLDHDKREWVLVVYLHRPCKEHNISPHFSGGKKSNIGLSGCYRVIKRILLLLGASKKTALSGFQLIETCEPPHFSR